MVPVKLTVLISGQSLARIKDEYANAVDRERIQSSSNNRCMPEW